MIRNEVGAYRHNKGKKEHHGVGDRDYYKELGKKNEDLVEEEEEEIDEVEEENASHLLKVPTLPKEISEETKIENIEIKLKDLENMQKESNSVKELTKDEVEQETWIKSMKNDGLKICKKDGELVIEHDLDFDNDSIVSLSLKYGVEEESILELNKMLSDDLDFWDKAKPFYIPVNKEALNGCHIRMVSNKPSKELHNKLILTNFMNHYSLDKDIAQHYLNEHNYNISAAKQAYEQDENWMKMVGNKYYKEYEKKVGRTPKKSVFSKLVQKLGVSSSRNSDDPIEFFPESSMQPTHQPLKQVEITYPNREDYSKVRDQSEPKETDKELIEYAEE
mmetsp:Transcript_14249/g.21534  ORF Transcript_14249/g.21534 Transcript_14249/m.21534 type:complete len:334 (-) Transcript_14249:721-1722(-)